MLSDYVFGIGHRLETRFLKTPTPPFPPQCVSMRFQQTHYCVKSEAMSCSGFSDLFFGIVYHAMLNLSFTSNTGL